jgi:hypothetical protein
MAAQGDMRTAFSRHLERCKNLTRDYPGWEVFFYDFFDLQLNSLESGGQRRDRTADAGLFRAALYH